MFAGSGIWRGTGLSGVNVLPRKCGASGGLEVMDAMRRSGRGVNYDMGSGSDMRLQNQRD